MTEREASRDDPAEVVRKAVAAFNSGDDVTLVRFTSDFVRGVSVVSGEAVSGSVDAWTFLTHRREAYSDYRWETERIETLAEDTVLVVGRVHATPEGGEAQTYEAVWLVRVRGGLIAELVPFESEAEARRAAG